MTEADPITTAAQRYTEDQATADASKEAFFDVCANQVRQGNDTADTIAARAPFTAVTIRKALRERGVKALPRGPRSRKYDDLTDEELLAKLTPRRRAFLEKVREEERARIDRLRQKARDEA
jgi:hypothetical protein